MNNRDWEIFGKEICRNVQDAIDSRDFSRLNQTISDTINGAADEISRNVKHVVGSSHNRQTSYGRYRYHEPGRKNYYEQPRYNQQQQYNQQQYNQQQYQQMNYGPGASGMNRQAGYTMQRPSVNSGYNVQLYSNGALSIAGGVVLTVMGGIMGTFSLIMTISGLVVAFAEMGDLAAGIAVTGVFGILLLVSAVLLGKGISKIGKARRFRSYVKMLGYKEYGNIKELAQKINKSAKFVVKDIEKMIKKGWFKQGHLDAQKTCLITSHEAYQQYTELEAQRRNIAEQQKKSAQEEELRRKAEEAERAALSPEVQEVIKAGEEYVRIIRECNDAIPGEEISDKIYKIEKVVDSIFDRVEKNPGSVADLHRMMEYYLPTTVKLLKAYESLDAEPVQGENILSSKREIEKTLDTLNVAFEKLLDSLFEDTAWDLSSDISVLHTMLAQEGLTEEQMKK